MANHVANISETLTTADTPTRHATTYRNPIEEAGVSDTTGRIVHYQRLPVQPVPGTGVVTSPMLLFTRGQTISGEANQLVGQVISPMLLFIGAPGAIYAAYDTATRQTAAHRTDAEPLTTADVPVRHTTALRSDAETLTTGDTPARVAGAHRATSEALTTGDAPTRRLNARRQCVDSLTYYTGLPLLFMHRYMDVVTRVTGYPRHTYEAGGVGEALRRQVVSVRLNAETLALTETLKRNIQQGRRASETLTVADVVARRTNFGRTFNEQAGIGEWLTRAWGTRRSVSESWTIAGRVSLPLLFTLPSYSQAYDSATVAVSRPRSLTETLATSDSLTALRIFMAIMGWLWVDAQGNAIANLPDWGYALIEDPIAGTTLGAAPVPTLPLHLADATPRGSTTPVRQIRGGGPRQQI